MERAAHFNRECAVLVAVNDEDGARYPLELLQGVERIPHQPLCPSQAMVFGEVSSGRNG